MEIEKKFKLRELPKGYEGLAKKEIEQGYLCTDPVLRIRRSNESYILTYKSQAGLAKAEDIKICEELEAALTREAYLHLRQKIDGAIITKTRYLVPLEDGHLAELDLFHGAYEGFSLVEVEFSSEEEARSFVPPEWFGEDVSGDKRYTNKWLAFHQDWR